MNNPKIKHSTSRTIAICGLALAGFFILIEHREHVFQALPYLILLLCPLMHIFMHGSHHGNHSGKLDETEAYRRGLEDGKKQAEQQHFH